MRLVLRISPLDSNVSVAKFWPWPLCSPIGSELPSWLPEPQAEIGTPGEYIWTEKTEFTRPPDWGSCPPQRDPALVPVSWLGMGPPRAESSHRWVTPYKGCALNAIINTPCLTLAEIFRRSLDFPVFLNSKGGGEEACRYVAVSLWGKLQELKSEMLSNEAISVKSIMHCERILLVEETHLFFMLF